MKKCPSCDRPIGNIKASAFRCPHCNVKLARKPGRAENIGDNQTREPDENAAAKPAGLWKVMSGDTAAAERPPAPVPETPVGETEPASKRQTTGTAEAEDSTETPEPTPASSSKPKGLWSLMKPATATAAAEHAAPDDEDTDAGDFDEENADDEDDDDESADETTPTEDTARSRGALFCLLLGIAALPTSLLSLFPQFWMRIPTTILGFSALLIGYLAIGDIRRARGKLSGQSLAYIGMLAGTVAMFLGPLLVTRYGEEFRRELARRQTGENLSQVGDALMAYEREHQHFPPGSLHVLNKEGTDVALHSWQTMLLPYLGDEAAEIHASIDLTVPYSHASNRAAMQRNVPAFFASGANRTSTGNGYAVTHFVALGGQREVAGVGSVGLGIFDRNSNLSRQAVEDGLEHTLVAGEIAYDFPAWGEPDVYRDIGEGLNKERHGFGNARRDGAMFLKADGSVRFFSSKTDVELLRKLSTRNGGESIPADY